MGQYSKKGLYSAYDKNNEEREKDDYYSTPTVEVENIIKTIGIDFAPTDIILEPCCGGGHMIEGIRRTTDSYLIGTDIRDRGYQNESCVLTYGLDYLVDDYPYARADYIIMNPPFKLIEPFCIRSLEIARKGVLMFGRLQFLESKSRYENILRETPPTDVWVYVDRVACYKNGDTTMRPDSIQAYAWYYWDIEKMREPNYSSNLHWIRRAK